MINPYLLDNYIEIFMSVMIVVAVLLVFFVIYLYQSRRESSYMEDKADAQRRIREKVIDEMEEVVLFIDPDELKLIWGNIPAQYLIGIPVKQMRGRAISRISQIESSPELSQAVRACANEGKNFQGYVKINKGRLSLAYHVKVERETTPYGSVVVLIAKNVEEQEKEADQKRETGQKIKEIEKLGKLGYWEMMNEGHTMSWSRGLYDILGYEVNAIRPNLDFLYKMVLPADQGKINTAFVQAFQNQQAVDEIIRFQNHVGEQMNILLRIRHTFDRKNNLVSTLGFMQNVTELSNLQQSLDYQTSLSKSIIDHSELLLFVINGKDEVVMVNTYLLSLIGREEEDVVGKPADEIFLDVVKANQNRFSKTHYFEGILEMPKTRYGNRFVRWSISKFTPADGEDLTICLGIDMTQSELARKRLSYQAEHDEATGLFVRKPFELEVSKYLIKNRHKEGIRTAVLTIFLSGSPFEGHAETYSLRKRAVRYQARRLRRSLGEHILLDYDGANTFRAFLPNRGAKEVEGIAQATAQVMNEPVTVDGKTFIPHVTVGAYLSEDEGADVARLCSESERAAMEALADGLETKLITDKDNGKTDNGPSSRN